MSNCLFSPFLSSGDCATASPYLVKVKALSFTRLEYQKAGLSKTAKLRAISFYLKNVVPASNAPGAVAHRRGRLHQPCLHLTSAVPASGPHQNPCGLGPTTTALRGHREVNYLSRSPSCTLPLEQSSLCLSPTKFAGPLDRFPQLKYPALTAEEEETSTKLQALYQAIF